MQARDLLFSSSRDIHASAASAASAAAIPETRGRDKGDESTPLLDRPLYQSPIERAADDVIYSRRKFADVMAGLSVDDQALVWMEVLQNPMAYELNKLHLICRGTHASICFAIFGCGLTLVTLLLVLKPDLYHYFQKFNAEMMAGVNVTCGAAYKVNQLMPANQFNTKFINDTAIYAYGNVSQPFLSFCSGAMNHYYNKYSALKSDYNGIAICTLIPTALFLPAGLFCLVMLFRAFCNDYVSNSKYLSREDLREKVRENLVSWLDDNNIECTNLHIKINLRAIREYQYFLSSSDYLKSPDYKKIHVLAERENKLSYLSIIPLDIFKIILGYAQLVQILSNKDDKLERVQFHDINVKSIPATSLRPTYAFK